MAAVDLTAPASLPKVSRDAQATTAKLYNLPTNHGTLILTVCFEGAAGWITFDPTVTDGGAMPAAKIALISNTPRQFTIPPTSMGGVTKFGMASDSATPTASVEVSRFTLT